VSADWVPTARLRWVFRDVPVGGGMNRSERVLQQWHAQDLPSYMKRANEEGAWIDVPEGVEAP
jgi:hypothetical protein